MTPDEILKQQDICLQYSKDGKSHGEIAALTGLSYDKVYRRISGAHWRQFRTIHRPNRWARLQGLFSYASLCALTVHRDRGLEYETIANIKPVRQGTPK